MFGSSAAVTVAAIALAVLGVVVIAGSFLGLFTRKREPVAVVQTRPSLIDNAWLSKEEMKEIPSEELRALYVEARRNTPGTRDSGPFPVLTATMGG